MMIWNAISFRNYTKVQSSTFIKAAVSCVLNVSLFRRDSCLRPDTFLRFRRQSLQMIVNRKRFFEEGLSFKFVKLLQD
jgi:hypothetical protein